MYDSIIWSETLYYILYHIVKIKIIYLAKSRQSMNAPLKKVSMENGPNCQILILC